VFKAAAAGEVANAETIAAERAALQRLFSHFVLHDQRDVGKEGGKVVRLPRQPSAARLLTHSDGLIIEPVARPEMVLVEHLRVGGNDYPVERLRKVSLQIPGGGSKATAP
jgi:hypothetical protein